MFIQPADGGGVVCNGAVLSSSQWLRGGDVIVLRGTRIAVELDGESIRLSVERPTDSPPEPVPAPTPRLTPPPRDAESPAPERVVIAPADFTPKTYGGSRRRAPALRLSLLLTWAGIALLAAAAWFTFTARAVEIRVEPEPDSLDVRGALLHFEFGDSHMLRPGTYTVVAAKEGYRLLEAPLVVSDQGRQVHELRLQLLPGRLAVSTDPREGVRVAVDGKDVGVTPLQPVELEAGEHVVEFSADRYRGGSTTVTIGGAGSLTEIDLTLQPLWAAVSFDSSPRGAQVSVDGEAVGRTPVTADVLEGDHVVEMRLDGYKPYRSRVGIVAQRPQSPPPPTLEQVEGWLVLTTAPAGATISIDGAYRGNSPLELELEPDIEHSISASLDGHTSRSETLRIGSGQTRELLLELEAELGEVAIVALPSDAELVVDGTPRGAAAQTLELSAVPHEIEVRKSGYVTQRRQVTPRPGFPQRLEIRLQTEEEEREERALAVRPPVIRTSQGQELLLVGPGTFQMGASRREPGRRANETLRQVEITRHFYIATEEVSNAELKEFRGSHRAGAVGGSSLDLDDHPVVGISWEEAARYCNWLSAKESLAPFYVESNGTLVAAQPLTKGYRLPTEAEWTWAARYGGGAGHRKYAWGDSLPVAPDSGNWADTSAAMLLPGTIKGYNDGYPATAPVDSLQPNVLGLFHLGGNAAEWVHDVYSIYSSTSTGVDRDPMGPDDEGYHVIRGASWRDSKITELRLSYRDYGNETRNDLGFRIARYAEAP